MENAGSVSSPVIDPKTGVLLYVNVSNGDIVSVEGKGDKPMTWANSGGSPSGIALDTQGNL